MKSILSYLTGPLEHVFDFKGRAGRAEFWPYWLWLLGLQIGLIIIIQIVVGVIFFIPQLEWLYAAILYFILLGGQVLLLSVRTRRLHDLGMSGWWQLLWFFPFVGSFLLLIFMALPGQQKENRFGAASEQNNGGFELKRWLFEFKGRTGRIDFWIYWLCMWAVDFILFMILFISVTTAAGSGARDFYTNDGYGWLGMFIALPVVIVADFVLLAAPRARRLHDAGMSGWWQLIWFIPYLGPLALCILMLLPPEKGKNRFDLQTPLPAAEPAPQENKSSDLPS